MKHDGQSSRHSEMSGPVGLDWNRTQEASADVKLTERVAGAEACTTRGEAGHVGREVLVDFEALQIRLDQPSGRSVLKEKRGQNGSVEHRYVRCRVRRQDAGVPVWLVGCRNENSLRSTRVDGYGIDFSGPSVAEEFRLDAAHRVDRVDVIIPAEGFGRPRSKADQDAPVG